MPLYEIEDAKARWHTIVVRASDEARAREIGAGLRRDYGDEDRPELTVRWIDPDGPEGVVIDDPS